MARIAGVDVPNNKRGVIALTYIFGIGRSRSATILQEAGVDEDIKAKDWNDEQIAAIRQAVGKYRLEGELRSEIQLNQAFAGYWMLQGNPSSSWSAAERSED